MRSPPNQSSYYRAMKTTPAAPSHQVTSSTPVCCGHRDWTESPASLSWLAAPQVRQSFIATPWEILPALHLALPRCTVWSRSLYYTVLDILLWRKLHKGAFLIIHGARFRFVPRCSGTENSHHCDFHSRAADRLCVAPCTPQQLLSELETLLITRNCLSSLTGKRVESTQNTCAFL